MASSHQFAHAWLNNRAASGFQQFNFRRTEIYSDNRVAFVGQAGGGHRADISQTEDADRPAHRDHLCFLELLAGAMYQWVIKHESG